MQQRESETLRRAERVCLSICKRHKPKHTHTNGWNAAKLCDCERLRCLSGCFGSVCSKQRIHTDHKQNAWAGAARLQTLLWATSRKTQTLTVLHVFFWVNIRLLKYSAEFFPHHWRIYSGVDWFTHKWLFWTDSFYGIINVEWSVWISLNPFESVWWSLASHFIHLLYLNYKFILINTLKIAY